MVESKVKEKRFAGDGLEVRRKGSHLCLLSRQGGVHLVLIQATAERLQVKERTHKEEFKKNLITKTTKLRMRKIL